MSDDSIEHRIARRVAAMGDAAVAERMQQHGFWPPGMGPPSDPEAERLERERIGASMRGLAEIALSVADVDAALREERKRQAAASAARKAERRAERAASRAEARAAFDAHRETSIVFAGVDVSAGLEGVAPDRARLDANGLPVFTDAASLASAMGTTVSELRFLTFHRRGATLVHYHRFGIPKKTGGIRAISAPKQRLARAQSFVLREILARVAPTEHAHGFVAGRSILTNAAPHVGRAVVVNLDLENFFPTIGFRRVKGLFRALGYGEHVATLLSLLTTEPPRLVTTLDGTTRAIALGDRVLPQGASTSPAITNLLCRRLDRRLFAIAKRRGFTYTRYADDLTFSSAEPRGVGRLLRAVREVLADEGFREHPSKTRIMRRGSRHEVTGLVVNERVALPREARRTLRAILHNASRTGLAAQNREDVPHFEEVLRGKVAYAIMVEPARRDELLAALSTLTGRSR